MLNLEVEKTTDKFSIEQAKNLLRHAFRGLLLLDTHRKKSREFLKLNKGFREYSTLAEEGRVGFKVLPPVEDWKYK